MEPTAFVTSFTGAALSSRGSFTSSSTSRRPASRPRAPQAILGSRTSTSTFGASQTQKTYTVKVMEKDRCTSVKVEQDTNLRKALLQAKVDLYTLGGKLRNCGGAGQCGTCAVDVEEGAFGLSPPTMKEDVLLQNKPESWRLACRATVVGDVTIRTKPKV